MDNVLASSSYKIKILNFEGPFDLLFHLIEKNKFNIYDIPVNEITEQYMDYLFSMEQMDLEVASEFLVMAATLLHIKSKMLLPENRENPEEETDPREELVIRLIEYRKFKELSNILKEHEKLWENVYYKLPEVMNFEWDEPVLDMSPTELRRVYQELIEKNKRKINTKSVDIQQIVQQEKVSMKSKMREIARLLMTRTFFKFNEVFSFKHRSKLEVVTGFMAILELSKMKKARLEQKKQFSDILIYRNSDVYRDLERELFSEDDNVS
ncbi:MAG: segregation/condensation protein A [Bacillota bacterium]|nr:segregation/condensation protein A [Bacillota bacterium]